MQAHAAMMHGQLKIRTHARVIIGPWGQLAVSDLQGGVCDGVGCCAHSAFYRRPARDSGLVATRCCREPRRSANLHFAGRGRDRSFCTAHWACSGLACACARTKSCTVTCGSYQRNDATRKTRLRERGRVIRHPQRCQPSPPALAKHVGFVLLSPTWQRIEYRGTACMITGSPFQQC